MSPDENTQHTEPQDERFSAFDLPTRPDETAGAPKKGHLSKRVRSLLIAVAAMVLLALALVLITLLPHGSAPVSSSEPTSEATQTYPLYDKTAADAQHPVTSVEVKNSNGSYTIEYSDKTAGYILRGYDDIPLSKNATSLVEACTVLNGKTRISTVESLKDFGLEEAASTATIHYADGTTGTLLLGNEAPSGDGYYACLADSSEVYIIDTDTASYFIAADWWYVSTTLMTAPTVRDDDTNGVSLLRSLSLTGKRHTQPLSLRRVTDDDEQEYSYFKYVTTQPYFRGVTDSVGDTMYGFTSLYAERAAILHPTAEQRQKYGFNDPYTVAKVTLAVESTSENKNSSTGETESTPIVYNNTTYTITVGCIDTDGNYVVMVDGIDVIYIVTQSSLKELVERQNDNTTSSLLFLKDITTVGQVDFSLNGEKHTFTLTHNEGAEDSDSKLTVQSGGKTYPTSDFRKLYSITMGLERYKTADNTPTGTPDLSIAVYALDGRQAFAADFYNTSGSLSTVRTSDGEFFCVKVSTITKLMTQLNNYLNGDPVLDA